MNTTITAPDMGPDDLRAWRKRHKLTQTEAGALFGIDLRTIQRYEKGEQPIPASVRLGTLGVEQANRERVARYQERRDQLAKHVAAIDARRTRHYDADDNDVTEQTRGELVATIADLDAAIKAWEA